MQRVQPGTTTLVDVGSYKLEVTIHGPPRRAHNPAVIIIPGIGSSVKEWAAVTNSLAESISVVNYERAGFGQSEPAPDGDVRTAADLATELHSLLRIAKIAPPYIVVCHSYGGIIAQEFVHLRNLAQFKGFVFVYANTTDTFTQPNPCIDTIRDDIDTLQLCYQDFHALKDTDWNALREEEARPAHKTAASREISQFDASGKALAAKDDASGGEHRWGGVPIVVLQADHTVDLRKLSDHGVKIGNGAGGEKAEIDNLTLRINATEETRQRKLSRLSTRSSFRPIAGTGRKIHLAAPEEVVDAVIWILQQYRC